MVWFLLNVGIYFISTLNCCFHLCDYRARRLQGRPRTRLWSQRQQEPRSNLLRREQSTCFSLKCITSGTFHTNMDYLSPCPFFFFTGLRIFTFQLAHRCISFVFLGGGWGSPESGSGLRFFYLPFQHLLPVFLLAKVVVHKFKCVFPLIFEFCVYFCGTNDCQVVTDKYFCQVVVERDKRPLVLQNVNGSVSFTFLFNLFLLELKLNWLTMLLCMNQWCFIGFLS